ncbi:MAG: class I SAM-dependent methyltransferase, partial [Chloroflexia bacterium]
MKKLLRQLLTANGLQVSRISETIVLPKPHPGPTTFHCRGIDWGIEHAERFIEGPLRVYEAEYNTFSNEGSPNGNNYYSDNPFFGFADAAVCYSFVRDFRPSVVVEVGSGFSSRVIRAGLDKNETGRLVCIDPEPRVGVASVAHEYKCAYVETISVDWFRELPADTILFIDSSHRMGVGSDVNFLFLEVLPELKPGTIVHVHD